MEEGSIMNSRVVKFQTGKQVANTDIKRISSYIPVDLHERIQESANKNRRSFNQELLWLAEKSLEHQNKASQ